MGALGMGPYPSVRQWQRSERAHLGKPASDALRHAPGSSAKASADHTLRTRRSRRHARRLSADGRLDSKPSRRVVRRSPNPGEESHQEGREVSSERALRLPKLIMIRSRNRRRPRRHFSRDRRDRARLRPGQVATSAILAGASLERGCDYTPAVRDGPERSEPVREPAEILPEIPGSNGTGQSSLRTT